MMLPPLGEDSQLKRGRGHLTWRGWDAVEIRNDDVSLVVVPELGAKVVRLYHRSAEAVLVMLRAGLDHDLILAAGSE